MTYYEELGISPRAAEAEIRRSYKRLTLLLHPDQQQDPEMRALAEAQMRRLNEMVSILTDPERRYAYDQSLRETSLVVRGLPLISWSSWIRNNRGWVLVGVATLIALVSALLVPNFDSARPVAKAQSQVRESTRPQPSTESAKVTPRTQPALQTQTALASLQETSKQRSSGDRHEDSGSWRVSPGLAPPAVRSPAETTFVPPPHVETADRKPEQVQTPSAPPEVRPTPPPQVAPAPIPAPPTAYVPAPAPPATKINPTDAPALAGKWVYTPDARDAQDPKLFPAEYVELSVAIVSGRLRASYRSRYKLDDHKLSPYVNFTFEGPSTESLFAWRGDSGAKGEIRVRLESPDSLKVNWFATEMGSALSLGSGSATLYRFR